MVNPTLEHCRDVVEEFFKSGTVYVYNNPVTSADLYRFSFKELLSHDKSSPKISIGLSIHQVIVQFFKEVMQIPINKVLDVGCGFGHFSFLMAEEGADVVGVEIVPMLAKVASCVAQLKNYSKVNITNMSIREFIQHDETQDYDLCLMLNVFDEIRYQHEPSAWSLLKEISSKSKVMVFLGIRKPWEVKEASMNATIQALVLGNSCYANHRKLLSNIYYGRDLWVFW